MKQNEKPNTNPEIKKDCNCGPECTCGCNEGRECTCGCHGGCKCGCKNCGGKIIALIIVFLAGMGFNELLHGCFGRCPNKGMRPAAMMTSSHRVFDDGAGTVVIINTGGDAMAHHKMKKGGKHHHNMMKHPEFHHGMQQKPQPETEKAVEKTAADNNQQ